MAHDRTLADDELPRASSIDDAHRGRLVAALVRTSLRTRLSANRVLKVVRVVTCVEILVLSSGKVDRVTSRERLCAS